MEQDLVGILDALKKIADQLDTDMNIDDTDTPALYPQVTRLAQQVVQLARLVKTINAQVEMLDAVVGRML